jgi:hypothetical protein
LRQCHKRAVGEALWEEGEAADVNVAWSGTANIYANSKSINSHPRAGCFAVTQDVKIVKGGVLKQ